MKFEDIRIAIRSQEEDVAVRQALQEMGYRWADGRELTKLSYWQEYANSGGYYLHTYLNGTVCEGCLGLLNHTIFAMPAQEFLPPLEEEEPFSVLEVLHEI